MVNRPFVRIALAGLLSLITTSAAVAATIEGFVKVRDSQGNLIPASAVVTVTDENGNDWDTNTATDGSFSLTVPAGTYSLVAEGIQLSFTEDCEHLLDLETPSSIDTCLVVVE
jgi:hypothetical protein